MQQFVVPQFIDVEDKIFGPITTRQFLILLLTGGLNFIFYKMFDMALFAILLALTGGFSLILAFVKINGQPFHYFILNIGQTLRKPSLRIWRKEYSKDELEYLRKSGMDQKAPEAQPMKIVKHEHIRDLSLLVNTGGYYKPDEF